MEWHGKLLDESETTENSNYEHPQGVRMNWCFPGVAAEAAFTPGY